MAEVKISDLPEASNINNNDYLIVNSGTQTKKIKKSNMFLESESTLNKITTISSTSTNEQYPSAKAVYDYIQSLDGNNILY